MTVKHTELFCYAILLVLLLSLLFCKPYPANATHLAPPQHYISIEFDLKAGSLKANSRIILPAGLDLHLDLSSLNVSQVIINGQPAKPDQTHDSLDISSSGKEQEILISYSREIRSDSSPYNLIDETGITLIDSWYPVADQEMLFKLTAHIPETFEAISEADEIITFEINSKKQITFRFQHPLFNIHFIAGPYVVTKEIFADNKNLVAYFFQEDQALAAGYIAKAQKYLARYEEMLGPYPYSRFAIVENRLPTGFAMPTFTLLGQSVVRLPFIVDTSLGHEVLHSWFGNGVRMSPREGNWVEGLTTYLADQSFAADKGEGPKYRKEQLVKYQSYVRPDMDLVLRNFNNVGHGNITGQPVRAVGYNKSSMFFHMLRKKLGPEVFSESLRDFYKRAKFNSAGWSDIRTSFESISGLDLKGFFSQWLDRNDVPLLSIQQPEISNKDGFPVVHFSIVQKNDSPYVLDVPVVIKTAVEEIHKTLSIAESRTTFDIPMTAVPETLTVDPQYDLMRKLAATELPPTWSRFMGAENKLAILPTEDYRTLFNSFLEQIAEADVKILLQDEVTDKDLAGNSLVFLGTSRMSRALFARPDHSAEGFTLDVRRNPLNTDQIAVLVSAASPEQVEFAAPKLRHYGKYSYLSFMDGHIQEKNITETDHGLTVELFKLPAGTETRSQKTFADILTQLLDFRVIYVGEGHTNYEDHQLQLEIIRALYDADRALAIGMEMFTRQTQSVIDQYMAGELDEKTFLKESHYFKTWRFDYRLYRDIINFAKHNHIPVIALNLEKDITSQVFKGGGPNSLDDEDAGLLPVDRKLDEPGYRERISTAFMMHAGSGQNGEFSSFLQAQALWDETMAETIAEYLENNPDDRMVVIAGQGHVDRNNAIPPRVGRRLPVDQTVVLNSHGSATEFETADFIFFSAPASLSPFPLLGVMLDDTEDEEGVQVKELNPKGRAQEAGIKEKDIILAIDGEPVNDMEDLKIEMLYKEKSEALLVRVRRKRFPFGHKELDIEVPLQNSSQVQHM
ncbi:MAG: ChaN family lipoprotein [Deltaproteobacteria bacterium]|nr:ChaN family lipoprotein [Deltaproteobacteria bacterium]